MHSQGAVDARAVNAQEHAVWDTGPTGIFGSTVEACLSRNNTYMSVTKLNTMVQREKALSNTPASNLDLT